MNRIIAVVATLLASSAGNALAAPVTAAPDPYLWLEQVSSHEAMAWVEGENKRSLGVLEGDSRYAGLYADALKIAEATDKIAMPEQLGGRIVNFWQDAAHVRGIWRTVSPAGYQATAPAWRTLIDLDALAATEKANWVWHGDVCEPVAERRCMILLSDGGEDADSEREFDVATGAFVPGGFTLPTSKQIVAWETPDTLLVARDWGAGTMTGAGYPFVVKRLERGQTLAAATETFRGEASDVSAGPASFVDGAGHAVTLLSRSPSFFENLYWRVTPTGTARIDVPRKSDIKGLAEGRLVFQINEAWTPNLGPPIAAGALVAIDPEGRAAPETIFAPGSRQSLDSIAVTRDHVLAAVYENVRGRAISFARIAKGWVATPITLPDNAAVDIVSSDRADDSAYIAVQSFLLPTTVWRVGAAAGSAVQVKAMPARFDAAGLVTEQFEATSTDGTKVPYFITRRRDIARDGTTPTMLTAYGGFQISMTPWYGGATGKLWLEKGGAFAVANIRGGGEFGPAWHEAALKTKRQVAYDDFAAVARDMIARGITSPRRLGIYGGSNGGLLMGVELTQHPELWNAVAIEVPLLDMLRYEQLSAGASWVGEYGSVKVPEQRAFLAGISPYDNLKRGVAYLEPFIWTTTKDDRVGPAQARKFAARMREYGLPYLYWENVEGGHGAGANLKEQARAKALEITYFTRRLMDPQAPIDAR